ncbi:MAG: ribosomal-protein-alanine N-acetyltransferase [Dehalococcoidia bacterium]|nr:MAG: ribosomal-protein-alanine N-acetyltransferase [Dehalococcoidia bacterium]
MSSIECVIIILKLKLSSRDKNLSYYVRLAHKEDIAQVTEIDREAFPTLWPPVDYEHELQSWLAHYIVAYDDSEMGEEAEVTVAPEKSLSRLTSRVRQLFNDEHFFSSELPPPGRQYIIGFAGFWIMADEAHITNIAVRKIHRRRGIGELLLISIIDLATELNARNLTLEVRASNTAAQSLYYKYGFSQVGLRRGYYTDNKEDAVLMSAENITSASFQSRLNQLKKAHSQKWGIALYQVVR